MESELTRQFLSDGYSTGSDGSDLLSPSGKESYELKLAGRGVRDLRNAALRLATYLVRSHRTKRGYVLASLIRISANRVRTEWSRIQEVLLPDLAARMYLVAVIDGMEIVELPERRPTPVVDRF